MERWILLADMNSFFASVHQALDPGLKGKPVLVTGNPSLRKGIILASSYEAKKFGVKTGMPIWEAKRLIPHAILIQGKYDLYVKYSKKILTIMGEFTPLVEPFSIDEAFLDITGCQGLWDSPIEAAHDLKEKIKNRVGIMCSVGISTNKLLAKMAAEMEKPDGLTLLLPGDVKNRIWPLPVRKLFGVGPRIERRLHRMGVYTIGDLAEYPIHSLKKEFGINGMTLYYSARGIDHSPVDPNSLDKAKSMGHQLTLSQDAQGGKIRAAIIQLSEKIGRRVRYGNYVGRRVGLVLRDKDLIFNSWTRVLPDYTDLTQDIIHGAMDLLNRHWSLWKPVRLVGVNFSDLIPKEWEQQDIFGERRRLGRLAKVCDKIWDKYGENSLTRGSSLVGERISKYE